MEYYAKQIYNFLNKQGTHKYINKLKDRSKLFYRMISGLAPGKPCYVILTVSFTIGLS